MKKLIVFDMDGVLIDSLDWIRKGQKNTLKEFGVKFNEEIYVKTSGMSLKEVFGKMAPKEDFKKMEKRHDFWLRNNLKDAKAFPKVKFVLNKLSKNYKIGLWTGRRRWMGEAHLKIYDLNKYFDCKVYADDTRLHKPHPTGLNKIMKKLKIKPSETVYVGDALIDVLAARKAKVTMVGSLYGIDKKGIKGKADYEIRKFEDVLRVINEIEAK